MKYMILFFVISLVGIIFMYEQKKMQIDKRIENLQPKVEIKKEPEIIVEEPIIEAAEKPKPPPPEVIKQMENKIPDIVKEKPLPVINNSNNDLEIEQKLDEIDDLKNKIMIKTNDIANLNKNIEKTTKNLYDLKNQEEDLVSAISKRNGILNSQRDSLARMNRNKGTNRNKGVSFNILKMEIENSEKVLFSLNQRRRDKVNEISTCNNSIKKMNEEIKSNEYNIAQINIKINNKKSVIKKLKEK